MLCWQQTTGWVTNLVLRGLLAWRAAWNRQLCRVSGTHGKPEKTVANDFVEYTRQDSTRQTQVSRVSCRVFYVGTQHRKVDHSWVCLSDLRPVLSKKRKVDHSRQIYAEYPDITLGNHGSTKIRHASTDSILVNLFAECRVRPRLTSLPSVPSVPSASSSSPQYSALANVTCVEYQVVLSSVFLSAKC